jgi:hypothetical protein
MRSHDDYHVMLWRCPRAHPRARRSQLFDKRCAGRVGTPLDNAAQAVAIDLERIALNRFQSWLWLAAHNATAVMHVATRM